MSLFITKVIDSFVGKDFFWWVSLLRKVIKNPHFIFARFIYNCKRFFYDIFAKLGFIKYEYNIIFIAGMPMSATTWIKTMVARIPGYFVRTTPMAHHIASRQDISYSAFKYTPNYGYTLFKTHLNPSEDNIRILLDSNVKKVIVSYRDYRDVVIARYYRLISVPKRTRDPHYMDYTQLTKEEAINHCIDVVADDYVDWIEGWVAVSQQRDGFVHFCRFEKLLDNPLYEFNCILKFYKITLNTNLISNIVSATLGKGDMVDNINKGTLQSWAFSSNFRSGKVGGWEADFNAANKDYFKTRLGQALISLGYETNMDW